MEQVFLLFVYDFVNKEAKLVKTLVFFFFGLKSLCNVLIAYEEPAREISHSNL